ncbi:hypothetical protein A7X67_01550 [Clostridium sp. W14A]|nr:hypothetical protein A7X67_01550 [Clostridium sp. W14A]
MFDVKKAGKNILKQTGELLCDNHGLEAWEIAVGIGVSAVIASYFIPGAKEIVDTIVTSAKSKASGIFD